MNVILIASAAIAATLIAGALLAVAFSKFGEVISSEAEAAAKEKERYNPALTMGHMIPVDADVDEQLRQARLLAAKKAALTPRGANVKIGKFNVEKQPTASNGAKEDPVVAVKIAAVHGWQGLLTGSKGGAAVPAAGAKPAAQAVAPAKSVDDLVPGKDYPYIEITDDMSPAELRKARIANAKAKSAAVKALKEAAVAAPVTVQSQVVPAADESVRDAPAMIPAASEPVPGVDYEVIEITDEMDPAEIRKARIANAKAKSAAMKAFKERGGSPVTAVVATPTPEVEPASTPAVEQATSPQKIPAVAANIPEPDYIEITDDMDPADVRKARIHNAKAKSAYNKALKEAGIDPASIPQ